MMVNTPSQSSESPRGGQATSGPDTPTEQPASSQLARWLADPLAVFALPLAVFMLVGMLEPTAEAPLNLLGFTLDASAYPIIYIVKIVLTMVAIGLVWPGYRQFEWRVSPLAFAVGAVGAAVWIGLCEAGLEARAIDGLRLNSLLEVGRRSAFDPFTHFAAQPMLAWAFLAVRFWGLAVIVPVIEEFFLRGLVMRYFLASEWWKVPFGTLTPTAILVGTLVPIVLHPVSELFAVVAWFSLVTWLMAKTRNIWDCVVAHMLTNLLLGLWVIYSGHWFLW
jgi:CAAX prenyl protease-like protein